MTVRKGIRDYGRGDKAKSSRSGRSGPSIASPAKRSSTTPMRSKSPGRVILSGPSSKNSGSSASSRQFSQSPSSSAPRSSSRHRARVVSPKPSKRGSRSSSPRRANPEKTAEMIRYLSRSQGQQAEKRLKNVVHQISRANVDDKKYIDDMSGNSYNKISETPRVVQTRTRSLGRPDIFQSDPLPPKKYNEANSENYAQDLISFDDSRYLASGAMPDSCDLTVSTLGSRSAVSRRERMQEKIYRSRNCNIGTASPVPSNSQSHGSHRVSSPPPDLSNSRSYGSPRVSSPMLAQTSPGTSEHLLRAKKAYEEARLNQLKQAKPKERKKDLDWDNADASKYFEQESTTHYPRSRSREKSSGRRSKYSEDDVSSADEFYNEYDDITDEESFDRQDVEESMVEELRFHKKTGRPKTGDRPQSRTSVGCDFHEPQPRRNDERNFPTSVSRKSETSSDKDSLVASFKPTEGNFRDLLSSVTKNKGSRGQKNIGGQNASDDDSRTPSRYRQNSTSQNGAERNRDDSARSSYSNASSPPLPGDGIYVPNVSSKNGVTCNDHNDEGSRKSSRTKNDNELIDRSHRSSRSKNDDKVIAGYYNDEQKSDRSRRSSSRNSNLMTDGDDRFSTRGPIRNIIETNIRDEEKYDDSTIGDSTKGLGLGFTSARGDQGILRRGPIRRGESDMSAKADDRTNKIRDSILKKRSKFMGTKFSETQEESKVKRNLSSTISSQIIEERNAAESQDVTVSDLLGGNQQIKGTHTKPEVKFENNVINRSTRPLDKKLSSTILTQSSLSCVSSTVSEDSYSTTFSTSFLSEGVNESHQLMAMGESVENTIEETLSCITCQPRAYTWSLKF